MKQKRLVGVILLLLGILVLGGTAVELNTVNHNISVYESSGGQINRMFNKTAQEDYQNLIYYQGMLNGVCLSIGIVLLVIGVALILYDVVNEDKKQNVQYSAQYYPPQQYYYQPQTAQYPPSYHSPPIPITQQSCYSPPASIDHCPNCHSEKNIDMNDRKCVERIINKTCKWRPQG